MNSQLETICLALDSLAAAIVAAGPGDQTYQEVVGWNTVAITRHDLASIPTRLSARIRALATDAPDPALLERIKDAPRKLQLLQTNSVPQLPSGNAVHATVAILGTMQWLTDEISTMFTWSVLQDTRAMPDKLARRLRAIQADIENLAPDKDALKKQIEIIRSATEAAETLPTDLQALEAARSKVEKAASESDTNKSRMASSAKDADALVTEMQGKAAEASKLVALCEEAYRITTTKGLAAAFDLRASSLANSMWVWVLGLLAALAVGSFLGAKRVEELVALMLTPNASGSVIAMNGFLALVSVGAPLWFAWLSTKQIGQRFRLSEDYAFKASVAKAYEGYRKEAARIDSAFEARLFSSALTRLEEAPLRLVEKDTHGSPWHEFIASDAFRTALDTLPALKEKFVSMTKTASQTPPGATKAADKQPSQIPVEPAKQVQ